MFSGYIVAPANSSLFMKQDNGQTTAVLIYLDDLILIGDDTNEVTLIQESFSVDLR